MSRISGHDDLRQRLGTETGDFLATGIVDFRDMIPKTLVQTSIALVLEYKGYQNKYYRPGIGGIY